MRNIGKHMVCCILAVALILLGMAGCNQSNSPLDPKNPVRITLWHYYSGTQEMAFDNMVSQFNQTIGREQGIQVEAFNQGGVNDLAELVLARAEGVGGEELPDIFAAYADTAYELKLLGITADLGEYITDEELSEYVESFWEEGCLPPDNVPTIFPIAKSTEVLQIDAIAWNEFTSAVPAVSDANLATWEGISEAAELYFDYTDAMTPEIEGDGKALLGLDSPANYLYVTMRSQGITLLSNDGGQGVINLDAAALRNAFDIYYGNVVRGWFAHVGRFRSDDVTTGEIIGFVGSSTGSMYFPKEITYEDGTQKDAQLASYVMPSFANGSKVAIQQGAGMVVTKSDEKREYAAVEFLKWLTQKEQNLEFTLDSAYLPVKRDALFGSEMEGILEEMTASDDVGQRNSAMVFQTVLEQFETHELYYTDPFPGLFEVRRVLESLHDYSNEGRQQLLDLIDGGATYDEALEEVLTEDAYQNWVQSVIDNTSAYLQ